MVMPSWLPNPVNTGASIGDAPPANYPAANPIIGANGVTIDGSTTGITFKNGAVTLAILQPAPQSPPGLQLMRGGLYLAGGSGNTVSVNCLWGGAGAPSPGLGNNGDYYFRNDTPGTANQRIYAKAAGAWTGII